MSLETRLKISCRHAVPDKKVAGSYTVLFGMGIADCNTAERYVFVGDGRMIVINISPKGFQNSKKTAADIESISAPKTVG